MYNVVLSSDDRENDVRIKVEYARICLLHMTNALLVSGDKTLADITKSVLVFIKKARYR